MFEEVCADDTAKRLMPGAKQRGANAIQRPADVEDGIDIGPRFQIGADEALRRTAVAPCFAVAGLPVDHLRARSDLKNRPRHRIRDPVELALVVKSVDSRAGRGTHLRAPLIPPRSRRP